MERKWFGVRFESVIVNSNSNNKIRIVESVRSLAVQVCAKALVLVRTKITYSSRRDRKRVNKYTANTAVAMEPMHWQLTISWLTYIHREEFGKFYSHTKAADVSFWHFPIWWQPLRPWSCWCPSKCHRRTPSRFCARGGTSCPRGAPLLSIGCCCRLMSVSKWKWFNSVCIYAVAILNEA